MANKLVIVESPAKAKTIGKYLGGDYTVRASLGHVRDLPKSKLGVDVDNDFRPQYLVPREKAKQLKELKSEAQRVNEVIIGPRAQQPRDPLSGFRSTRRGPRC